VTLLTLSGLHSLDSRYEEASTINHSPIETIFGITLPLLFPFIVSGTAFVFIFSLFNYGVPALLRELTYPVEIFTQFSAFYNEGRATSLAFPLVVLAVILLILQRKCMGKRSYVTVASGTKPQPYIKLGRFRTGAVFFVSGVLFLTVFLPLIVLLIKIGSFESIKAAWRTSSSEVSTSILFSAFAATILVVFGFLMSNAIETLKKVHSKHLDILTFIPFAFPATVVGIGLIYFWNNSITEIIYKSSLILIIAYIIRFIPFAIRGIKASLEQIGPTLKEAAMLSEKSWIKRVVGIDLPLALQGIAAGWVIAFVLCMSELGVTLLVIPPGQGTLALKIYTLMHYGSNKLVAALSLILILTNLVVTSAIVFVIRKRTHLWRAT
jgi:iron(III) transport system permease protein